MIADDGASDPLPTASVLAAAQSRFAKVIPRHELDGVAQGRQARRRRTFWSCSATLEGGGTNLYIGKKSVLARSAISTFGAARRRQPPSACAPHRLRVRRDWAIRSGHLPGTLTAKGAGAVVGTLSMIVGPHGAAATTHLLRALE